MLASTPFLFGTTACDMRIKTTRVTSQNYWLPLHLVTICHKSGDPLPPLGCDVIYRRPHTYLFAKKEYIFAQLRSTETVINAVFFQGFQKVSWLSFKVSTPFSLLQYVWYL